MYDLPDYVAMVLDRRRTSAYLASIAATVRPGDVVLELGAGFGFFAIAAALRGARHVFAVEPNDAIALGPGLAAANGVAERVTFLQGTAERVTLPERATVLLEDLRGVSPLHGGRLASLEAARERLLTPDARWITLRDRLMVAPARRPPGLGAAPAAIVAPDGTSIQLAPLGPLLASTWSRVAATEVEPLGPGACWAELSYPEGPATSQRGAVALEVTSAGELGGFVTWFEATLSGDQRYDTGPGPTRTVYDCGWLPLDAPAEVMPGDCIELELAATFDGTDYVWSWDTLLRPRAGPERRSRQSNLAMMLRTPARLRRRRAAHVPRLDAEARLVARAVALADGERTLAAIAAILAREAPDVLRDEAAALRWAGEALARLQEHGAG